MRSASYYNQNCGANSRESWGKYVARNQAAGTKAIEDLVRRNIKSAKTSAFWLRLFRSGTEKTFMVYYNQVKAGAPMDYKDPKVWKAAFGDLPYPGNNGEDKIYTAFGYEMSASNLGNLNAAAVAKSYGIPTEFARWQFGAAHLRDHPPYLDMPSSQTEALKRPFYGDSEACYEYTGYGFDLVP